MPALLKKKKPLTAEDAEDAEKSIKTKSGKG
jgi:hypothetical protein